MKKRNKTLLRDFESRMGLTTKSERVWFWCGFALLLAYLEVVLFLQNVFFGSTSPIFLALSALAAVPLCFVGVECCRKFTITPAAQPRTARGSRLTVILSFVMTLAFMLTAQVAFFPGSFVTDNIVQMIQVYSGSYNNWHPALHTWLFFALPMKLVPHHWFIVTLQLIWYSAAVSYFLYVLYTSGCPRWLIVFSWFYIVCNPNSVDMLLHPLKDCAMTIFCLVLFSQLIRIYLSRGQWLKKPVHLILFSVFAFLSTGMRHNAILLIAPVFLFLLIFFPDIRKQAAAATGLLAASVLLWQNVVLPAANVVAPAQRTVEMVGLPMTVLCDIYVYEPDGLTPEAREFMDTLASEEEWAQYEQSNFNSVKWLNTTLMPAVDEEGAANILRYMAGSALRAPTTAAKAFANLTHLVWGLENTRGFALGEGISENTFGIAPQYNDTLKFLFTSWRQVCNEGILKYAFTLLGPTILLLLFLAVSQLGGGNLGAVFLVLSPMAYHFGTMLLLSGPDYRFFHMHYVILIPVIYIILMNKRLSHAE